ncbi:MFS transporter [Brevibacillus choshinensis]|uniref:MFS transporter n=1 Tax=Brevibacillus choshinensis TaxID=54911 RepID=A0ABX7FQ13_BRECH|nr:MFS transporter [Brevibacillus choshinensis]QRG68237.1 MFS transporter [Brevibacillus choshinensis]
MGEQREKLWSKDFVLITVSNLLLFLIIQMQLPTFPTYAKETYLANDFMAGLTASFFALGAIVARIFTGELLKSKNSKVILIIGLCIVGLTTAGYYWTGSMVLLLLMRALFGFGFGISSTTLPTIVTNAIPAKRIGEGMGYYGLSQSLAQALGPMVGLFVLSTFGFGSMLSVGVVLILLIFPLTAIIRAYKQPNPGAHGHEKGLKRFYDKKILLPAFLNFCMSITYGGLVSFLAIYGKEAGIEHISWFFLCNAIAIVLVRPVAGKLFDKKGHIAVFPPGAILIAFGLIGLSMVHNDTILIISALLYGLGYGCIQPSTQAWMVKEVKPEQRGMANGFFLNSIDCGIAIGSILLGTIAAHSSYAMMYRLSALLMVLFLVVYFVSLAFARKQRKQSGVPVTVSQNFEA